jgi:deoxyribodipyrimidine photo-lyase
MSTVIVWFRQDLRLHDQRVLWQALAHRPQALLPVLCLPDSAAQSPWGFARIGPHRKAWLTLAVESLSRSLEQLGCPLLVSTRRPGDILPALARAAGTRTVLCEEIPAPEERTEVDALREAGLAVETCWQGSLIDPDMLPWPIQNLPRSFTPFRQGVERHRIEPAAPLASPLALPGWPACARSIAESPPEQVDDLLTTGSTARCLDDPRSSLPRSAGRAGGGEAAGLAHLADWLERGLPHRYKATRNQLSGIDFSSKWSPWLAHGALSPRHILAELRQFESRQGASEGSYWLWFELLWRDYFRLLALQQGARLFRARGLADDASQPPHDPAAFERWLTARTGQALVDAGMRELQTTGYLSNRMRQIVASYLVHDLACDWRAGAAWFEHCLIDHDVFSNHGNWLYIAGRGTDPRGGRHFDIERQTAEHDPHGHYRHLWAAP